MDVDDEPPAERSSTAGRRARLGGRRSGSRAGEVTRHSNERLGLSLVSTADPREPQTGPGNVPSDGAAGHRPAAASGHPAPRPGRCRCCTELGELFAAAGPRAGPRRGPGPRRLPRTRLARPRLHDRRRRPTRSWRSSSRWADAHWDIGREFGTIGLRRGEHTIEVTTYRADAYDRSDAASRVVAFGDNLEDDLVRRDFTVNAMALRLPRMEFVDPHGGLADLAARRLRTPGTPEVSFGDDPLRMMRAARFAAQLGVTVAPEVRAAMTEMAAHDRDRVGRAGPRRAHQAAARRRTPRAGLRLLVETGLADHVLPELPALRLEVDEHHRHKDVYEHSLTVLDQAIALEGRPTGRPESRCPGPDLVLRLAALLHDIGKPATRRFEDGGGVTFHHHEVVGAKLTAKRLKALRFDKETVKAVARLVELHLRFHGYGDGQWTDSAVRRYVTDAGPLLPACTG